jgi:putative transcriptional regulator
MGDPRFRQRVIAMCVHDPAGALGLVVNQPHREIRLHGLLEQLEIPAGVAPDAEVLAGGPVEPGRGFVLHSTDWAGQDSIFVRDRWVLTGTLDVLRAIAEGRGPKRWLVALGYAGWGEGQLENEMRADGWHAADGTVDLLWDVSVGERWKRGWAGEGIDVTRVAGVAGRA